MDGSAQEADLTESLLWEWTQQYGPLFKATHFGQPILYLADPHDIREYLPMLHPHPDMSQSMYGRYSTVLF